MSKNKPSAGKTRPHDQFTDATQEMFPDVPDELRRTIAGHSAAIDKAVARINPGYMNLASKFLETQSLLTKAYIAHYGESRVTRQRAATDAVAYLTRLFGLSASTIRLYINSYERFHDKPDAIDFLRLTDMQLLLGQDIDDSLVDAVIRRRRDDPAMSTRAVKAFIANERDRDATRSPAHPGEPHP